MTKKAEIEIYVPYVYYYLFSHKDELLVPLMRGSANVSLNEERLGRLRIPVPIDIEAQKELVRHLVQTKQRIESLKRDLSAAESDFENHFSTLRNQF